MAWPKKNDAIDNESSLASTKLGARNQRTPYEGNQRNSSYADDNPGKDSSSVSFAGSGAKKGGFKPQLVGGPVGTKAASGGSHRGGRYGQGGFARVFQRAPGSMDLGANASGPRGPLFGSFGI